MMRTQKFTCLLIWLVSICSVPAVHGQQANPQSEKKTQDSSKKEGPGAAAAAAKPTDLPAQTQTTETPKGTAQGSPAGQAEQLPKWFQRMKAGMEVLAYVSAFLFFLYKLYIGQSTTNLTLSMSCKRAALPKHDGKPSKDQLAVVVTIKKGENGLIKPLRAEVRVVGLVGPNKEKELDLKSLDMKRVDYKRSGVIDVKIDTINWGGAKAGWPSLNFPPGDGTQFACFFEGLLPGDPYQVDVVFMGKRRFPKLKTSQWRASDISLPLDKENQRTIEPAQEAGKIPNK